MLVRCGGYLYGLLRKAQRVVISYVDNGICRSIRIVSCVSCLFYPVDQGLILLRKVLRQNRKMQICCGGVYDRIQIDHMAWCAKDDHRKKARIGIESESYLTRRLAAGGTHRGCDGIVQRGASAGVGCGRGDCHQRVRPRSGQLGVHGAHELAGAVIQARIDSKRYLPAGVRELIREGRSGGGVERHVGKRDRKEIINMNWRIIDVHAVACPDCILRKKKAVKF